MKLFYVDSIWSHTSMYVFFLPVCFFLDILFIWMFILFTECKYGQRWCRRVWSRGFSTVQRPRSCWFDPRTCWWIPWNNQAALCKFFLNLLIYCVKNCKLCIEPNVLNILCDEHIFYFSGACFTGDHPGRHHPNVRKKRSSVWSGRGWW